MNKRSVCAGERREGQPSGRRGAGERREEQAGGGGGGGRLDRSREDGLPKGHVIYEGKKGHVLSYEGE